MHHLLVMWKHIHIQLGCTMQHKDRVYGTLICCFMHVSMPEAQTWDKEGKKNDIRVSGGRVINILGDDYLHECYESMHSRVDKSTVNVKLIASCCGHMSFKRKRWTIPCCKRSEVIGRSDSLSPLEILIKVLETSCFREYKCVLCWFMQKTGVQIKDR